MEESTKIYESVLLNGECVSGFYIHCIYSEDGKTCKRARILETDVVTGKMKYLKRGEVTIDILNQI